MKPSDTRSTTLLGMLCMASGAMLLATNDAITKWLIVEFHVGEIMFFRGLWAFPVLGVLVYFNGGVSTLRLNRPKAVWGRAVVALLVSVLVTFSFINLPLAEAAALIFMSPIFLTAFAPLLLREHVGIWRWAAVLLGFVGVLMMIQPGTETFNAWVFFPLAAAACSATRDIITRKMGTHDSATAVMVYTSIVALIGGAVTLPFGAHWPTLTQWGWFALAGTFVSLAHLLIVKALQLAAGAVVSPLKYLSLVWSAVIGYLVWGDMPGALKVAGAALVVVAGLLILYRETRRRAA
ncbi:MAG: DMT family transporter [Rhodospirillaceae bacterium]|nr:DMT family transporter [Rhodospirillaceae bacterium]